SLDLLANDSTYLKATILPANATASTVTWASSSPAIATVDATSGLLKGLTLGETTITATADGKSVAIKINVTNTEYNYGVAANFKRRVNVRASASGLSKLVGFAYIGDTFKILGKTGSWYLIQYNNTTKAYIWASYIKASKTSSSYTSANGTTTPAPGATATPTTSTPTKVTIANCQYAINVRASASTSSARIGKGSLGATFTYLGKEGDWYKIQYNTTTVGYVFATFATLS
ncbi:MAG: SH3 domain-containing protein, partial [Clostridiaceae bacterium]